MAASTRPRPWPSPSGLWRRLRPNGCASAAIGIRAAASRSTCPTRPAPPPRGCGCRIREWPPIAAAAKRETGAELKAALVERALTLGFDVVRVARAELTPEIGAGLDSYIAAGNHGEMDWLAREPERRRRPNGLWDEA